MTIRACLLASAALTFVTFASADIALARRGADDPAGHVRQGRGADDPLGDVRQGGGADDPATHDVADDKGDATGGSGGGNGADDPATHDVADSSAGVAATSRRVEHPPEVQPPQQPEPVVDRRRGRR